MGVHKFNIPKEVDLGGYKIVQHGLVPMLEINFDRIQYFLDTEVVRNLQPYVARDTGAMERSIKYSPLTQLGEGRVAIDTPYASYQAYSPKITKQKGLRGTLPFERMVSDKGQTIQNSVIEYSRRLFQ